MANTRTFGQKLAAGFAALLAVFSVVALRSAVRDKDEVIDVNARNLIADLTLEADFEGEIGASRGFMWTGEQRFADDVTGKRAAVKVGIDDLRAHLTTTDGKRLIEDFERDHRAYTESVDRLFALRRGNAPVEALRTQWDAEVTPIRVRLSATREALERLERARLDAGETAATDSADRAVVLIVVATGALFVIALAIALVLVRTLNRQLGTAVQHVQASATQLTAATAEQAAGAREQTAATQEVTTTLKELAATSRQMTESAQRVVRIAGETGSAARLGDATVARAQAAIAQIKGQVDLVVKHMLELGKKSQQVGGVLELINELSEQTNILAINATIESAGAGEAGRRFAVVADEIRKLADRVAISTKEIRMLVEDIRSSANTTVMVTEDGAKAVDAGTRQFGEVTAAFGQISNMIDTTTDAAREIELGSKQQVSAVDQVAIALQGMGQAIRDTETSTKQTVDTATQLNDLSRSLVAMIRRAEA